MRRESSSSAWGHPNPCLLLANLSGLTPSILGAAATPSLGMVLGARGVMLGTVMLSWQCRRGTWHGGVAAKQRGQRERWQVGAEGRAADFARAGSSCSAGGTALRLRCPRSSSRRAKGTLQWCPRRPRSAFWWCCPPNPTFGPSNSTKPEAGWCWDPRLLPAAAGPLPLLPPALLAALCPTPGRCLPLFELPLNKGTGNCSSS